MAESRPPRTRVSQACKICGFKKIKCGGELPRCRTCVLHNRECIYGVSKRNTRLNLMRPMVAELQDAAQEHRIAGRTSPNCPAGTSTTSARPTLELFVPVDESSRLFQTYFSCIHPIWPILYKPLYDSLGYHQLGQHLPKAVVYSIYAIAACLPSSSEEVTPPESTTTSAQETQPRRQASHKPVDYFDAALAELQRSDRGPNGELKLIHVFKPSIAHCQALTLLALQQHGLAEFSRAGVLCGLATSMAIDLRLHRNHWSSDPIEREVCSRLWWNIYILEKMMSFEMGRPAILHMEETDTPYPSIAESDEFELFTPLIKPKSSTVPMVPTKMQTLSAFATTIDMCKIMERVSRDVYSLGARESIRSDRAAGDRLRMKLWQDLQDWKQRIESTPLRLDLSGNSISLPATVTNYVTIQCATILLHRPFIAHWQQYTEQTGYPPFNTPDPSRIIYDCAKEICTILEAYNSYLVQMPCDLIFPIFTAASTLLHESRQSPTESAESKRQLRQCLYWLSIFAKNWKSAGERQKLFNELYELPNQLSVSKDPFEGGPVTGVPISAQVSAGRQAMPQALPPAASAVQIDDTGFADILTSVDDWGFLNVFGDSSDTFYDMNTEFRNVLEGQHESSLP